MIEKIILGTYTRRESKGIYTIDLDTEKEELANLSLAVEENSPTYVAKVKLAIFTQLLVWMD